MTTVTQTLTMTRGDTADFLVALTDGAGDPLDLTGLGLTFTAERGSLALVKTIGVGIVVTDLSGGECTVTIDPADTEDLEERTELPWDLAVDDGAGDVRTALIGRLSVELDSVAP